MFGLFKKKTQTPETGNHYAGLKFGPFLLAIPEDWTTTNDNGTLRATKNDAIRLNVSMRDMSQVPEYTLDDFFETIKSGYYKTDINWAAYSAITKKDDLVYQTLEYLDDPRMVLAVVRKKAGGKDIVLNFSLAGNSGKDVETHLNTFTEIVENVSVLE